MAYRNGTYVAFHAEGTNVPIDSDIKYYNLLKAWTAKGDDDFSMINSHEKTAAVRDSSKRETLRTRLKTRLKNSKHLLLIIGKTTKKDTDWVPFEICYAIDKCEIPVIAAYTDYDYVLRPPALSNLWPPALKTRIDNDTARVIHIPFKKEPIKDAINQFDPSNLPEGALIYYTRETYEKWGLIG
ncbi:MAG: TIR domain-containing protein [Desulfobacteraceae bacterium]|nr:TIR domain-containing protein [Desulfobacteraceae bacterium]